MSLSPKLCQSQHQKVKNGRINLQKVAEEINRKTLFAPHLLRTDVLSSHYNTIPNTHNPFFFSTHPLSSFRLNDPQDVYATTYV